MNKTIIITDMDGTLARMSDPSGRFDVPIDANFFAIREPLLNVISHIDTTIHDHNRPSLLCDDNVAELHVFTLSPDSQCDDAKTKWLDKHVKTIPQTINCFKNTSNKSTGIFNLIKNSINQLTETDNLMVQIIDDDATILLEVDMMLKFINAFERENVVINFTHISCFVE